MMLQWTIHLSGGPRRVNHAACVVGNTIYSFGGYWSGSDFESTIFLDTHVLNTNTFRWSLIVCAMNKEHPYSRFGHTAVSYGKKCYIWGGRNEHMGASNKLFCFDTGNHTWSHPDVGGDIPHGRDGHSACIIKTKMFIFGGYDDYLDRFTNHISSFNFETMNWTNIVTKGKVPKVRDFHSATSIGDCMYVFGGRSELDGNHRDMYPCGVSIYDPITYKWTQVNGNGDIPPGRRSHSAWSYDGCLYIFGGFNGNQKTHFNDLYRFDSKSETWTHMNAGETKPSIRRRQSCCRIEDTVYMFGGTGPINADDHTLEDDDDDDKLVEKDDLHILDFNITLQTLCLVYIIKNNCKFQPELSCLPVHLQKELQWMSTDNEISRASAHG